MNNNDITIYYSTILAKKNNEYYWNAFGRYIDEFSKLFTVVHICIPV